MKTPLRFPVGLPAPVRQDIKQYLSCQESVKMLASEIEIATSLGDVARLTKKKESANNFILDFERRHNLNASVS